MDIGLVLAVAVAGGLGACIRYVSVEGWPRRPEALGSGPSSDRGAPPALAPRRRLASEWRLMIVNVVASFIAGFAAGLLPLPTLTSMIVISGFCGGMSSWSSVMLDAANALRARRLGMLAIIVIVQMLWGVLAALVGLTVGQELGEGLGVGLLGL